MRFWLIALACLAAAVLLARSTVFTVDRTEFVYVTQFGRPIATYDGETEAGLHTKFPWPVQAIQRLERRLQVFDLGGVELLTHDPSENTIDKTLTVSAYVCWRIADRDGVDRFIRTVGDPRRAEAILGQRISSRLGAEIGRMKLDDLISEAPASEVQERMNRLSQRLLYQGSAQSEQAQSQISLKASAREAYGIDLVDIRLRRFNYPAQVRDAIFDRIRSERNKKVADYQSQGAQLADGIRSKAEAEGRVLVAEGRATEERLKGQAQAEADRIRNKAQLQDVAFYSFLKKLAEYQRILGDNKSVLLLSGQRDLFDLLFKPPSPEAQGPPQPQNAALPTPGGSKDGRH
jgi:membrane protease subunit HflC